MTPQSHNRTLVWIVLLLLVVHGLYALALVTVAKRVVIFYLPARVAPATSEPRIERAPARRSELDAFRLSAFRGLDPAAFRRPGVKTPACGFEVVVLSHAAARRERRTRAARSAKGPRSRDWEPSDVRCQVAHCPCNRRGRCTLPSQIDIGPDGKCRKADEFKSGAAAKPAPVTGD